MNTILIKPSESAFVTFQRVFFYSLLSFLIISCSSNEKKRVDSSISVKEDNKNYELKYMLEKWSESFIEKTDSTYQVSLSFYLADSSEVYQVEVKNNVFEIIEGETDSYNISFSATKDHYNRIFRGDITAMTSMGQATSTDPIPLNFDIQSSVTGNTTNDFLFIAQRFFNRYPYDLVRLGEEHARIVHGGLAIPIFYQKTDDIGVRSAWYQINKGEQVNEPGDTNPFPQYFIITQGEGYAKIGRDTINVKKNEAYYIPPHHDHVFWNENEEPIVYIFLAWGKGA
ncbi:cupin domain-containing protein [Robertkochia aurantiaca]|uniref:cupin domain-containing protein n=1 Tax=Robertkochia aurantiaca TaxID=2873700 RepID=UPI001CCE6662|nr:cupin domain-containing protein [Robertkochia sp. 3YJGBD-33]